MKAKAYVNAFVLLVREDEVLLSLRANTGWEDGTWSTIVGSQEQGESVLTAASREAFEEAGVKIKEEDLVFSHMLHHNTGIDQKECINVIFVCKNWEGEIENKEPHKCGELKFFKIDSIPENIAPYLRIAILKVFEGVQYSEYGWEKEKSGVL